MGMSASQMRYVLISGSKSDVEFQGQQINQQRTTLATQTSAYNSQLLTLNVPTPPSTDQFKTTSYSFSANGETCTITGTEYDKTKLDGFKYKINYTTATTGDLGQNAGTSTFTTDDGGNTITANNGNTLSTVIMDENDPNYDVQSATALRQILEDCKIKDSTGKSYGDPGYVIPAFYQYDATNTTMFVKQSDISFTLVNGNGSDKATSYNVQKDAARTESESVENAKITWSDSGRMSAFTTKDADGNEETFTLSVVTSDDDDAYENAYNEYEFQRSKYENQMDGINAQIDIIQTQDKKLELKLQDLDTKQKALSTEMDSIKKVIDKNIETSFKAFA